MDRFLELQQKLRSYLRLPDIKLGLAAFNGEWKMMLDYGNKIGLSFIMNDKIKSSCENIKDSIYAAAFSDKHPIVIDDLTKLENKTVVEEEIIKQGILNIIIAPLYYQDELVGILELGSPNKGDLNSLMLKKLKEVLSLFSIAVSRNIEEMQNRIQALINEECTAIHQTVEWRFKSAAFKLLHQKESDPGSTMEDIVFDNLYPLYGLSDIRNSSIHRISNLLKEGLTQVMN
jgi:GAF domain-containing protein